MNPHAKRLSWPFGTCAFVVVTMTAVSLDGGPRSQTDAEATSVCSKFVQDRRDD